MFNRIKALWEELGRPIYVGKRLESNLKVLTYVSIVTTLLSLVLIIMDVVKGEVIMTFASVVTFLSGFSCAYFAGVRKNRKVAAAIPTIFCYFMFTFYIITGVGAGLTLCWSLLLPLGISYFVGVRQGIILSAYYTVLYKGLPLDKIREQLVRGRGSQFDPQLTDAFLALMDTDELEQIAAREHPVYVRQKTDA